jgi:hypothetical protein
MLKFAHDIAGGQGNLIATQVKSPNFSLSGKTGWAILRNGDAYFFNITATGDVTATAFKGTDFDINSAGAFFYSGTPADGDLITSIASAGGTDGFGNAYLAGIVVYDSAGDQVGFQVDPSSGEAIMIAVPGGLAHMVKTPRISGASTNAGAANEAQWLIMTSGTNTSGADAALQLISEDANSAVAAQARLEFGGQVGLFTGPGGITACQPGQLATVETWHTFSSLSNSWTGTLRYMFKPDNTVALESVGALGAGTLTNGTTIATLPSGYRPTNVQQVPALISSVGAGAAATPNDPFLEISTGGVITIENMATQVPTNVRIPLGVIALD